MAEVMVDMAVTVVVATHSEAMPQAMLRLDTLLSAVDVVTILRGPRAETGAMQLAHIIGMAAVNGEEAVTGAAITGIRRMDIRGSGITAWAMAIRTTGVAIMVTVTGIIRTTETGDTILTSTDSGRP